MDIPGPVFDHFWAAFSTIFVHFVARFWIIFGPVFDDFWVAFFNDFAPFCGPALTPLPILLGISWPDFGACSWPWIYEIDPESKIDTQICHKRGPPNGKRRRSILRLNVTKNTNNMTPPP